MPVTHLKKASDYIPTEEFMKFFIAGDYGTGKSEFAATAPTPGFVFDFDNKIATYGRYPGWDYANFDNTPKGWMEYDKTFREVKDAVDKGEYKTIVNDSCTSMLGLAMERALQLDPKRSETNGPLWNVHFQMVKNLLEGKFRQMYTMNCNVIVIAHLEFKLDNKTGDILDIAPLLTGRLAIEVPGMFEEVYCSFTRPKEGGKTEYYLRTTPKGMYKARSTLSGRMSLMPAEIPNSYTAVISAYRNAVQKHKERVAELRAAKTTQ